MRESTNQLSSLQKRLSRKLKKAERASRKRQRRMTNERVYDEI
jgi:hypothetical protein